MLLPMRFAGHVLRGAKYSGVVSCGVWLVALSGVSACGEDTSSDGGSGNKSSSGGAGQTGAGKGGSAQGGSGNGGALSGRGGVAGTAGTGQSHAGAGASGAGASGGTAGRASGGTGGGSGSSGRGGTSTGGASGAGDNGGSGLTGESGDTGVSGSAGAPPDPCPTTAPDNGDDCTQGFQCTYFDCEGTGQTNAFCNGTTVSTEVLPCASIACGADECDPGAICVEHMGGMSAECVDNPCGTHAVTCSCAGELCSETETCSVNAGKVACDQ
jgi:hypothetical protein